MVSKLRSSILASFALASAAPFSAPAQSVASAEYAPAIMRQPWMRGGTRFIRHWEIATGSGGPWTPTDSFGDIVEIGSGASHDQAVLVRAEVERDDAGPAELAIGAEGVFEVFVNGTPVYHQSTALRFAPDQTRVPVTLHKGENEVQLRLTKTYTPMRISLRVVAPGAVLDPVFEIAPGIVGMDAKLLAVQIDDRPRSAGSKVKVAAIAPGGRVMEQIEGDRNEVVHFNSSAWPDGPYEVRCTTSDGWRDSVTYLPWYKGDAIVEARRLIAAAGGAPAGPDGDHLRMLAKMVLDRLGGNLDGTGPRSWQAIYSPLMEYRELQREHSGQIGGARSSGFVRIAFTDPADGSTQYCRAYLPAGYDRKRHWPVVVSLHGFNPPNPPYINFWSVDERHDPSAETQGVIVLEPHGRGNAQYGGIGEKDVLRALAEAKRLFSVDEDRVYIMGESMGGAGTWLLASRHPGLFAAAAPFFGGWDFRLTPPAAGGIGGVAPENAWERFSFEAESSFAGAESLLHVPLFVHHGDADPTVSVEFSRYAVQMLQRWGYDIRYDEVVGRVHEDMDAQELTVDWLLGHRRPAAPRTVRIRASELKAAAAYWVQVDSFEYPLEMIDVDAEFVRPGLLRLDTKNVEAVTLTPSAPLTDGDTLHVVWNGKARLVALESGTAHLAKEELQAGELLKHRELEGPISDAIATPFVIVVGTISSDPQMREYCRVKAQALVDGWKQWQHVAPRCSRDVDVDAAIKQSYSLILIGGPGANSISSELEGKLPFSVNGDEISVDGRSWTAPNAVLEGIYPSPLAVDRYIVEVAATSDLGMYTWYPYLWNIPFGYPSLLCDWMIQDARVVPVIRGRPAVEACLAYGMFDRNWRRKDAYTYAGDSELRARAPMRHGPRLDPTLSPAEKALAGDYQLFPGFDATIRIKDGSLWLQVPPDESFRLQPEGDDGFGAAQNGGFVQFLRKPDGSPSAALANLGGSQILFHRDDSKAKP